MTLDQWTAWALSDARDRKIDGLTPLLESLGAATAELRAADWNVSADQDPPQVETVPIGHSLNDADDSTMGTAAPAVPPDAVELQSISELSRRLVSGTLSARELVERCVARIGRLNPALNAIIGDASEQALADATAADHYRATRQPLGPLHGIPFTLKDLIDQAGRPTTAASAVRRGHVAARDATVTARLRHAGAILVGKTNLHEFALGPTSQDSCFGPPIHPLDPTRLPGGSSGGSAAAVLAGMCAASIGTDTGGSIRIPAAACGLVGLKPTFGEIPVDGVVPLASSLDHVGPITRTVDDAWRVFDVLTGTHSRAPRPVVRIAELRLAVLEPFFCDLLDDGVRRSFESAIEGLRRAGARLTRGTLGHARLVASVYLHTGLAEAVAYHAPTLDTQPHDYTAPVRVRLEVGRYILAEDYVRARRGREVLCAEIDALLAHADALVLPTIPIAAPRLGASTVTIGGKVEPVRNALLRLTQVFNLTGHPALTLPIGEAEPQLPAGLQLAGRRGDTARLLSVALACEQALAG